MGNALHQERAPQGTSVPALHVAFMDTDMTDGIDVPKSDPADIARIALDGLAADVTEIVGDELGNSCRETYPKVSSRCAQSGRKRWTGGKVIRHPIGDLIGLEPETKGPDLVKFQRVLGRGRGKMLRKLRYWCPQGNVGEQLD